MENLHDEISFAGRGGSPVRRGRDAAAAQEVTYNPGYCAQFYPNAHCQNKGPNNPYTGDCHLRNKVRGAHAWGASPCAMAAEYYVGLGGRRYACY